MRTREVLIVVRREDKFLVVHRSPENGPFWHCISGGVEQGETDAAAAVRELREETGLEAAVKSLDTDFVYDAMHVECFVAEAPPEWEPTLDWEHDDYRWCSREEAVDLLHWPEPREIVGSL
jgi:dATP pyrophosphohydrolase